jgi:hypothetical protein
MDKNYLKLKIQENKIKALQGSNKKYPSNFQMAKNLASSVLQNVKSVAQGNDISLPDDIINKRKSICSSCDFYDKGQQRCYKCGCNMAIKTYLRASTCTIGKW